MKILNKKLILEKKFKDQVINENNLLGQIKSRFIVNKKASF